MTIRDVTGGYFFDILLIFPIYSIDAFSNADLRVVYFRVMRPPSSGSGVSILSLLTPDPFGLGFKGLSHLAPSLLFSIAIIECRLDSPSVLPLAAVSLALPSSWVALNFKTYLVGISLCNLVE